jgi:predicted ester cyclase
MTAGTEDVAKAYFDAVGSRDPEGMVACWEPGSIDRLVGVAELTAPDDILQWFGALFAAFPDFSLEVLEMVVDGTKAAVRWRTECTFDGTGTFMGLRPNGARVVLEGFDLVTVGGGRITGNQAYLNGADLARQLGALPPEDSLPDKAMLGALNLLTRAKTELKRR